MITPKGKKSFWIFSRLFKSLCSSEILFDEQVNGARVSKRRKRAEQERYENTFFILVWSKIIFTRKVKHCQKKKKDEHDLGFSVYVVLVFLCFLFFSMTFIQRHRSHTFFSLFCAAWGTITGSSNSLVRTFPRLPSVKIVERFFRAIFAENILVNSQEI